MTVVKHRWKTRTRAKYTIKHKHSKTTPGGNLIRRQVEDSRPYRAVYSSFAEGVDERISPEKRLLIAMIGRAIIDARDRRLGCSLYDMTTARWWLLSDEKAIGTFLWAADRLDLSKRCIKAIRDTVTNRSLPIQIDNVRFHYE